MSYFGEPIRNKDGRIIGTTLGEAYTYDALTERQKDYLDGMQYMLEQLDNVQADYDILDSEEPETIAKLKKEIAGIIFDDIKMHLERDIVEAIISFGDENYTGDEE